MNTICFSSKTDGIYILKDISTKGNETVLQPLNLQEWTGFFKNQVNLTEFICMV